MENTILIRFGEVFLKKGNRPRFLRLLRNALKGALKREPSLKHLTVRSFHGRYAVEAAEGEMSAADLEVATRALSRVFGVVSVSPAAKVATDYDVIAQTAHDLALREIERRKVATFRVSANRSYKRFPRKSPDIEREIGALIIESHPLPVRLKGAELDVGIEIFEQDSYVFARSVRGPGGLPVCSSGHGVLLLSGGIDSPVAGWMMAKRGLHLVGVHFHSYPYTTKKALQKVRDLAEVLAQWHGPIRLVSMPITPLQEYLRDEVPNDKLVLFYRRSMVRLAARVAEEMGAGGLITGESLGQVASQTLANIRVIEDASPLPILRPLIGMDKMEAVALAKEIGTFELSILPYDDCCSLFLPPHPDTKGDLAVITRMEEGLDGLGELEEAAWAEREDVIVGRPEDAARPSQND